MNVARFDEETFTNFPEFIQAKLILDEEKPQPQIRILMDSGCGYAAVTQHFCDDHGLIPVENDRIFEVDGVSNSTLRTTKTVSFCLKLNHNGGLMFTIHAIVLPIDSYWSAPLPPARPPWLSDLEPQLSDPDLVDRLKEKLLYGVILGGDYMALFNFRPIYNDHTFSILNSLAGWVLRGSFSQGCVIKPPKIQWFSIKPVLPHRPQKEVERVDAQSIAALNQLEERWERDARAAITDEELNRLIMNAHYRDHLDLFGPPEDPNQSLEVQLQSYLDTLDRAPDGRIIARLPKKPGYKNMVCENLYTGQKRIQSVIRMLEQGGEIAEHYIKMKEDWEKTGVIVETTLDELRAHGPFTELPHHGVIRKDSSSTPVRMVICGDAKDFGKYSTNDFLLAGVNVLPQIPSVITHIRMSATFVLADISKAFIQVQLHKDDQWLLALRWPVKQSDGCYTYKFYAFRHLPWGTKCSPSVLNCSLRFMYRLGKARKPELAPLMEELEDNSYVDDVALTGTTIDESVSKFITTRDLLAEAKFDLSKLKAYPSSICQRLGAEATNKPFKILGAGFDPVDDCIYIRTPDIDVFIHRRCITKRQMASIIARFYDPLGLASPVILQAKELRRTFEQQHPKVSWSYLLTDKDTEKWKEMTLNLQKITAFKVPRRISTDNEVRRDYHIFCDASISAVAAVMYAVSFDATGHVRVTLVASKSKLNTMAAPKSKKKKVVFTENSATWDDGINPDKPYEHVKINRLELTAAALGVRLYNTLKKSLENPTNTYFWTDSEVVLHWLNKGPATGVQFIDLRIKTILDNTSGEQWAHVAGAENPADLASRGCTAEDLIDSSLWRYGPSWLPHPTQHNSNLTRIPLNAAQIRKSPCPARCALYPKARPCEVCKFSITSKQQQQLMDDFVFDREVRWEKCVKRYGHLMRFQRAVRHKAANLEETRRVLVPFKNQKKKGIPIQFCQISDKYKHISPEQCDSAELDLVRHNQQFYDPVTVTFLEQNKSLIKDGLVWDLNLNLVMSRSRQHRRDEQPKSPIDKDLVWLPHSNKDKKDPKLNPAVELLMILAHRKSGHGPANAATTYIRRRFWFSRARKMAVWAKKKCPTCIHLDSKPFTAPEPPLPDFRYIGDKAFKTMGLDFVGPFRALASAPNGKKVSIAIFTCPLTRIVLLRPVEGQGVPDFRPVLNALCHDFCLDPSLVISDNDLTFKSVWSTILF